MPVAPSGGNPDKRTWKKETLLFISLPLLTTPSILHSSTNTRISSSVFHHRLKTTSSPGIFQIFSARLGIQRRLTLWTKQLLGSWHLHQKPPLLDHLKHIKATLINPCLMYIFIFILSVLFLQRTLIHLATRYIYCDQPGVSLKGPIVGRTSEAKKQYTQTDVPTPWDSATQSIRSSANVRFACR